MVSLEWGTGILPMFAYRFTGETPVLLSLEFANVASIGRIRCVCPGDKGLDAISAKSWTVDDMKND
jgi:hypothetical protein